MKLNTQQKIIAMLFGLLICLAIGALVFIHSKPVDEREKHFMVFSTSTPVAEHSPTGWWNSMPTDPSLPPMPSTGAATMTPTPTERQP